MALLRHPTECLSSAEKKCVNIYHFPGFNASANAYCISLPPVPGEVLSTWVPGCAATKTSH